MRRKRLMILLSILLLVAILVGGYMFFWLKSDSVSQQGSIFIPAGTTYEALIDSLNAGGGHIKSIPQFKTTAKMLGMEGEIRSGHYELQKGMSYKQVVRMFQRGMQSPIRLTFNNIRSLEQFAGRISQQIEPDSLSLIQTIKADTMPLHYGFLPQTFIAMFIPNTYEVYWNISPTGFLDRMKREYDNFWNKEREDRLNTLKLTRIEAVTLASIVYEETKMSDEMPTVAGVYINRLNKGMKLQADPTVKFAVGDFTLRRILYKHLEVVSPYNTYMYEGLPPGPISMPSVRAIDAVLDYKTHNYLFFCAKPDFSGYHNFAITNAEHNRNRDAWIKAVNQAGIR